TLNALRIRCGSTFAGTTENVSERSTKLANFSGKTALRPLTNGGPAAYSVRWWTARFPCCAKFVQELGALRSCPRSSPGTGERNDLVDEVPHGPDWSRLCFADRRLRQ